MADESNGVVITGIGAVSAFGRGVASLWQGLNAATPAETERRGNAVVMPARSAGPPNLDPGASALLGRCTLFAVDAAIEAVEDARLPFTSQSATLIGVAFGSEFGDQEQPVAGAPATSVARVLGIAGPVISLAGPAAGALAISEAAELVRRGAAPVMVAGGADAVAAEMLLQLSYQLSGAAARPFDNLRDGVVAGEGAAAVVLENAVLARDRGARIYAELLGCGTAFNRATVMAPAMNHVDAARAIQAALLRAEILQGEIDLVCASANGDPDGDHFEARALAELWGPNVDRLTVNATAGATGYAFAAAGPLSLVAALRTLATGTVPPTAGLATLDPAFAALDIVSGDSRIYRAVTALVNAFSAGVNVSIIVRTV